jgi:hypothetical protein
MTTAMGKEIKTETEKAMHTDKTIKTKATATPNADTTHYQEQCRENKTHQIDTDNESNDGQESYILNKSHDKTSGSEFYFANEKSNDTNTMYGEKKHDEPAEDTDDTSMISYATEDNEDTELMIEKTY